MKKLFVLTFILGNIFASSRAFAGTGQIGSSETPSAQAGKYASIANRPKPVLTDAQVSQFNSLIEANVDFRFQPLAKSFLEKAPIKNVRIYKGHLVIDVDTKGMYFEATLRNGDLRSSHKKYLNDATPIPFPSSADLKNGEYDYRDRLFYTRDYMSFCMNDLGYSFGPSWDYAETTEIKLSFLKMKWGGFLQPSQSLGFTFTVQAEESTFTGDKYYVNACDDHGCWGSYGVETSLSYQE